MELFKIKSYAKINLGLEIVKKREDGFHELNSLFIPIDLFDEITFQSSNKFEITVFPDSIKIPLQENLIYKMIKLIQNQQKISIPPFKIIVRKKIPIGAGLGGGSSNAAATLLVLNNHLNLNLSEEELICLAKEIGSDVPFFLNHKPALIKGKGDIIERFNVKIPFKILIVYPNFPISTKLAYSLVRIEKPIVPSDLISLLNFCLNEPTKFQDCFKNDFEKFIFPKFPILEQIKTSLLESGAYFASLSGSGSTVFGFFDPSSNLEGIRLQYNNFQTFETKAL